MSSGAAPWQELIGPSAPPVPLWPQLLWSLLGLLLLGLLLWRLWFWWQQPRRRARRRLEHIGRRLATGAMPPRTALHAAAACLEGLPVEAEQRRRLQQRFASQPPAAEAVLALLRGLQRGLVE